MKNSKSKIKNQNRTNARYTDLVEYSDFQSLTQMYNVIHNIDKNMV